MTSSRRQQSWSVVILCYNEKASVVEVCKRVRKLLSLHASRHEIIVVDDGSTDGSSKVVRDLAGRWADLKPVFHPVNRGIGEALRSGYFIARFENICAVPGDGQFDVRELEPYMRLEEYVFVSFYRRKQEGYNAFRSLISKLNKRFNRLLLGIDIRDVNWVKIYKHKELMVLDLRLKSSLLESEICAKLLRRGNRCLQVPSVYHRRKAGVAKGASVKTVLRALRELARLVRAVWSYRQDLIRRSHENTTSNKGAATFEA